MVGMDDVLIVISDDGHDDEELDAACQDLLDELGDLPLDRLERARAGVAPDGTRSSGAAAIDTLSADTLSAAVASPAVLKSVVDLIGHFLQRRGSGAVEVKVGGDSITLAAATPEQQAKLVDDFLARQRHGG
jgi:hypothetical protein